MCCSPYRTLSGSHAARVPPSAFPSAALRGGCSCLLANRRAATKMRWRPLVALSETCSCKKFIHASPPCNPPLHQPPFERWARLCCSGPLIGCRRPTHLTVERTHSRCSVESAAPAQKPALSIVPFRASPAQTACICLIIPRGACSVDAPLDPPCACAWCVG